MRKINETARYKEASFSKGAFELSPHLEKKVMEWIKSKDKFFTLSMPIGGGKTYFCAALMNLLNDNENIMYTHTLLFKYCLLSHETPSDLNYFGCWSSDTEEKLLEMYSHPGILILEDIELGLTEDWTFLMMNHIINYRYCEKLPTLITTSLDDNEFKNKIGGYIYSRIRAKDNYYWEVNCTSQRKLGL